MVIGNDIIIYSCDQLAKSIKQCLANLKFLFMVKLLELTIHDNNYEPEKILVLDYIFSHSCICMA